MTLLATVFGVLLVVFVPGLAAVHWAVRRAAGSGRAVSLPEKVALSVSGLGISCIALWLTTMAFGFSGWTAVAAPLAAAAVTAAAAGWRRLAVREDPGGTDDARRDRRTTAALLGLALASACLVAIPFATYGWERADGIHRMAFSDWEKHLVMTTAIRASPAFPPPHPYVHSAPTSSYYYGFHLVAAAVTAAGGESADVFASLFLLALVTAAAIPFVVFAFSRDFCGRRPAVLAAAAAALLVGFDGVVLALDAARAAVTEWPLPGGFAGLRRLIPSTHIDYWLHHVDRSFSAPLVATMWAPHHVAAALVALLVAYLLAPRPDDPDRPRAAGLLPGVLIAALPALSSYLALGLGAGVAGALLAESAADRRLPWRTAVFRRWAGAAATGLVLAVPIYPTLVQGSSSGLIVHVSAAGTWTNGAVFSWLFGTHQWTSLLDTPAVYLVDLGIIGVLGVLQVIHLRRARGLRPVERQAVAIVITLLLLLTFVRPPVGIGNNLYARGLLLAWFALAPFAAMAAVRLGRTRWTTIAVIVCGMGTAYAEIGYLLEGGLFLPTSKTSVEALRWIGDEAPPRALVAIHPDDYESNYTYWLERPLVLGGRRLALLFGADPARFDRDADALRTAYGDTDPERARRSFDALEADVILVRRAGGEPLWARPPCFDVAFANAEWTVVARNLAACARTPAPGTGTP